MSNAAPGPRAFHTGSRVAQPVCTQHTIGSMLSRLPRGDPNFTTAQLIWVVLWRTSQRISQAVVVTGALLVRAVILGKGTKRTGHKVDPRKGQLCHPAKNLSSPQWLTLTKQLLGVGMGNPAPQSGSKQVLLGLVVNATASAPGLWRAEVALAVVEGLFRKASS